MNQVQLLGNLTRDPEIRYTKKGTAIASFNVAASDEYIQENEVKERTAFVNCVAWGKLGEAVGMLNKGQKVLVNGRINTRSYEAQDGTKRYVTEVVADFIGGYLSNQSQTETSSFTDEFGGAAADDSYPF